MQCRAVPRWPCLAFTRTVRLPSIFCPPNLARLFGEPALAATVDPDRRTEPVRWYSDFASLRSIVRQRGPRGAGAVRRMGQRLRNETGDAASRAFICRSQRLARLRWSVSAVGTADIDRRVRRVRRGRWQCRDQILAACVSNAACGLPSHYRPRSTSGPSVPVKGLAVRMDEHGPGQRQNQTRAARSTRRSRQPPWAVCVASLRWAFRGRATGGSAGTARSGWAEAV